MSETSRSNPDPSAARRKRVTLRDVARRANVSTAVVSYVINDGPRPTSPKVRERVLKAIEELGYHPNAFARGLRKQRSQTIGFISYDFNPLDTFTSHYLASILTAMTAELKRQGYYLLMYPMLIGEDLAPLNRLLRSGRLDGVVVRLVQNPPATDQLLDLVAKTHVPAVCIERPGDPRFALRSVTYDDVAGARAATSYLIARGHVRIAHLQGDPRYATAQARLEGYQQALIEAGISFDPALVRRCDWNMSAATEATRELMRLDTPPTAIFAASDDMALGALEALRSEGYRVPADVSVIGFDDIPLASEIRPPLTTVRIPLADIGRRAIELLLGQGQPEAGQASMPEVLPVELVHRGTA